MRSLLPIVAFFLLFLPFVPAPSLAATSQWEDLGGGKVRLVAVMDPGSGSISAMVEVELEPGWKTYWREPGGSGIPPQFDFSGSKHFLPGEVRFPVPQLLTASGIDFPGYKEHVGFPFSGTATTNSPDGTIRLDLFIGVCEEICIPATASLSIPFSELMVSDAKSRLAIETANSKLPAQQSAEFSVVDVETVSGDQLTITARIPASEATPALFVEGPSGWYLPTAKLIRHSDEEALFSLDISQRPANDALHETKLRFTLVSGRRGVEQWLAAK